jgi:hypothetical protein
MGVSGRFDGCGSRCLCGSEGDVRAGANGIILSRKYSEMRLDNLRAAGRAIRETVKRA